MAPGQAVRHHPSRRIASVATIVVLALIAPLGLISPASGAPNRPAQTQTQGAPDRPATDPFGVADARPKPPGAPPSGNRPFGAARASESTGTASITVVLDAQPDDGQDVAFTGCGPLGCGPFILDDDADPARSAQVSGTGLDAGTYTVTQSALPGWSLAGIVCDTGEVIDLDARRATITLGQGEHATCTFTNTSAAIRVVLDARPDSAQDVAFTGCGPLGCGAFLLDDDTDGTLPSRAGSAGLAPGTYTITAAAVPAWLVTSLSCDTGEVVDLVARRATVTLTAGEQTTCTFGHEAIPALSVTTVVEGQSIPWDVNWTPGGDMLWTERSGTINVLPVGGAARELTLDSNSDFYAANEIGMMGLAVDPSFDQSRRIYTCQGSTVGGQRRIKVVAWTLDAALTSATRVIDPLVGNIPLGAFHGGCRLEFAPDGHLLVTTGDAVDPATPQSLSSLGGKVLRVDATTGAGAPDNVFAADGDPGTDARIYTLGHRNVQGLAIRPGLGQIWIAEHGPNVDDEVNLLQNGGNYGWRPGPGYDQNVPMTDLSIPGAIPARWSSGDPTLATSGATFITGSAWGAYRGFLAVATLKASSLRMMGFAATGQFGLMLTPSELDGTFGRLRTPALGPDGALYVTTSNGTNDRILRVAPV